MKKSLIILLLLIANMINVCAQNVQSISLKSVSLKQSDLRASTHPRKDSFGKDCAIVKVDVIGVKDLMFIGAVGNVDYSLCEYLVYIPEGTKELKYQNSSGSISGVINFDDFGLEIETKRVYNVVFESDNHIRSAIFSVQPQNAKLVFDGKEVRLDENGFAVIDKPKGRYNYSIQAKGYESQSGSVDLSEDEIFTTTSINLLQKMYPLTITCTPMDASLFIDNIPYGKMNEINDLKVPEGEHTIRLTAIGYEEFEQSVNIEQTSSITASMKPMKEQTIIHKEERTRTSVNLRNSLHISLSGNKYNKSNYEGYEWIIGLDGSLVQHFGSIFAAREGLSLGLGGSNKDWLRKKYNENIDSLDVAASIDIPIQLGISFPLDNYNNYIFSVFCGGYYNWIGSYDYLEKSKKVEREVEDYGLRFTLQMDLNYYTLGVDISRSLNGHGYFYGVKMGFKCYFNKG